MDGRRITEEVADIKRRLKEIEGKIMREREVSLKMEKERLEEIKELADWKARVIKLEKEACRRKDRQSTEEFFSTSEIASDSESEGGSCLKGKMKSKIEVVKEVEEVRSEGGENAPRGRVIRELSVGESSDKHKEWQRGRSNREEGWASEGMLKNRTKLMLIKRGENDGIRNWLWRTG